MLTGRNAGKEVPGRDEKVGLNLMLGKFFENERRNSPSQRNPSLASWQRHQISRKRAELTVKTFPNREHGSHAGQSDVEPEQDKALETT